MAERALQLQTVITHLHQTLENQWELGGLEERDKPPILEFKLGPQDWRVVEVVQKILAPLRSPRNSYKAMVPMALLISISLRWNCCFFILKIVAVATRISNLTILPSWLVAEVKK
ncbi:hypothetical protein F4821DRAFT_275638 [Hypoxylon rubiginosum]|uniref:Uncharacterized protein n=1 Tax=Hypoxylon rubiginosum TaxID=110542 RepID=A0ACC0CK27_9PEZI|nr:hypothetical protein F4821DRAFT_275638 [Hypoxylon rubiginosum]